MKCFKKVPWSCKDEWEFCRNHLFGDNRLMKQKALEHLYIWKIRSLNLPVAIEGTLILMEVYLREKEWLLENTEVLSTTMSFESWYSMAIIRFLNLIMDSNIGMKPTFSMCQLAKKLDIPEWIIKIRHLAAHGHSLPSLSSLREAVEFCLQWLYKNYWCVSIPENISVLQTNDNRIKFTFRCLDVCLHLNRFLQSGFRNINDLEITDRKLVCSIFTKKMKKETKKHIGNWSLNNLYESACKKLSRHIKKDVKYAQNLIDFILKNDQGLIHPDAVKKDEISCETMKEWIDILSIICNSEEYVYLLRQLINIVTSNLEEPWRKQCAALYTNKILETILLFTHNKSIENRNCKVKKLKRKSETDIRLECDKNNEKRIIISNINVNKKDLTDLLQLSMREPNQFVKIFLKNLINNLCNSTHTYEVEKLSRLVDIYTGNSATTENDENVYTVRDLLGDSYEQFQENNASFNKEETKMMEQDECVWSRIPLGSLPWQSEFFSWQRIYECH